MYNLTERHKTALKWIVEQVRNNRFKEEFTIFWVAGGTGALVGKVEVRTDDTTTPDITPTVVQALVNSGLLLQTNKTTYSLTGQAYSAVDSDFGGPDTSFLRYLIPLSDIDGFDEELKARCLPLLGAGGTDPVLWDSAVRTAAVLLENRLRDIGKIEDPQKTGVPIVNDTLGNNGTLAYKFESRGELSGYRDLYAGVIAVFRNRYAHRTVDPTPEDGGAILAFINLLLKMLEDLREE